MQKVILIAMLVLLGLNTFAQTKNGVKSKKTTVKKTKKAKVEENNSFEIHWLNINEALASTSKSKKKILIDFYTDWCGWCKRMDKATYENPKVIQMVNKYYLPVKFNAENEQKVKYKGQDFQMKAQGMRSTHELAISLLKGQMGYPTTSFLANNHDLIQSIPGYIEADEMALVLKYFGEDKHLTVQFDEFKKSELNK